MLLVRRIVPACVFIVSLLSFWALLTFPGQFWTILSVSVVLLSLLLWSLLKPLPGLEKIHHILLVVLFFLGALLYVSFNAMDAWGAGAALLVSLLVGFFVENLFLYVWNPGAYEPYSIEYFSRVLQYGSVFLYSAFLFFMNMAGISLFAVVLGGTLAVTLAAASFFITQKFETGVNRPLLLLTFVLFGQIFSVISLMPFDPGVSALLLTIVFYLFTGLLRHRYRYMTSSSRVQGYFVFSIASIVMVMLTARWR